MKIIGGKYQGRKVRTLKDPELRPTSSLVREALFNIITHNDHFCMDEIFSDNNTSLEIFCGSGIITFEILSRGIKNSYLLDYNSKLKNLFNDNAKLLTNNEKTEFITCDLEKKFPISGIKADFCFLDPPYNKNLVLLTLNNLVIHNCLNNKAIVVIESDKRNKFSYDLEHYNLIIEKTYGKSKLTFLQYKA